MISSSLSEIVRPRLLLIQGFVTSLSLGLGSLVVYLFTMSSYVGTEDPGEIATALDGMGILHPTGYPLYTMTGSLFTRLPVGDTVIWRLNLFSALLTACATFLFHRTFLLLLSDRGQRLFTKSAPITTTTLDRTTRIGAAAATLVLVFSALYWSQAVWLEVYALHLVFLALVLHAFIVALQSPGNGRPWLMFAYFLGLSFTHHMMTVLLLPAFLVFFFQTYGYKRPAWRRIGSAFPPFLLALTAYLYLPLRAAAKPLMNWGDPSTPQALWYHVRGAQYGHQMFSSWEIAGQKFVRFWADLPGDFGYVPLVLAALGLWSLRSKPRLLVFTGLIFATSLIYAINYTFDDTNFYLNAYVMTALWSGYGAAWIWHTVRGALKIPARLFVTVAVLCPLAFNYAPLDKSRDSLVHDYARNVFASLDSNAVYFSSEYERFVSPAFYLQHVEGFRQDVVVLDIVMLGNPWYHDHLEQSAPWLVERVRPELNLYRTEADRFLAGEKDTIAHNTRLIALFHAIVEKSRQAGHPVYVSGGINPLLIERYQHAPTGMLFRLLNPGDTLRAPLRLPRFAPLPQGNPLTPTVRSDYAQSYAYQGAYLAQWGDTAGAVRLLHEALALQPDFQDVAVFLESLIHAGP